MIHRGCKTTAFACFAACSCFLAMMAGALAAPSNRIAVLYPDIGEPYRSVFSEIIEGIEEQARGRVLSVAVGRKATPQEVAAELRAQDVRVVVALGRNGLKYAAGLEREMSVVAGGVISIPEQDARNLPVHSLAPDPALLFSRLQSLMPSAKRVFVVADPRQNGWLLKLARDAAAARGMELIVYEAADLKAALHHYQEAFAAMDARRDALWLPQDSTTVDEAAVLPLVLQEAWSRSFAVFSSSVVHVRRGALFSLYPDNAELGRTLGNAAQASLASSSAPRGLVPLRAALLAVNVRTASHLGLNLAERRFDLVFPEP